MLPFQFSFEKPSNDHPAVRNKSLICTCPKDHKAEDANGFRKRHHWEIQPSNFHPPKLKNGYNNTQPGLNTKKYYRSVSLGQILNNNSESDSDSYLTSSDGREQSETVKGPTSNLVSWDPKGSPHRELTEFEKSNLSFLKKLEEKRKRQHEDHLRQLKYSVKRQLNPNDVLPNDAPNSVKDRDSKEQSSKMGFFSFGPPRTARKEVLRSFSLDEDSTKWNPNKAFHFEPPKNAQRTFQFFLPLQSTPEKGDMDESDGNLMDTWWNSNNCTKNIFSQTENNSYFPSPRKKEDTKSPFGSPALKKRMLSSSLKYSRAISVPNHPPPLTKPRKEYRRSVSAPVRKKYTDNYINFTMNFTSSIGLPKCRSDLEDVGGRSPTKDFHISFDEAEETSYKRHLLPTTPESPHEDFFIEDTSRKVAPPPSSSNPFESKSSSSTSSTLDGKGSSVSDASPKQCAVIVKNPPVPQSTVVPPPVPAVLTQSTPPSDTLRNQVVYSKDDSGKEIPQEDSAPKKPLPMAFTVELGDSSASDSSGSGNTLGKKLDISGSLSQWVPKHKRNLSLTKVEENKKVEERQGGDKPPSGRPRSGTVGAGSAPARRGGYHSEGYFSSDQEDDSSRRNNSELKSPRSPRTPDLFRSPSAVANRPHHDQDPCKTVNTRMRPQSPSSNAYGVVPLNESATFILEKVLSATPEMKRKHPNKAEGRACCKERERKPSVSELTGKTYKTEKNRFSREINDISKRPNSSSTEEADPIKDEDKDDVSEAGTYTIDKDSPSPEVENTRQAIDRVFGIPTESEAEMTSTTALPLDSTTDVCPDDETSWMSASEGHTKISILSRNSPNWIQQWAAQVAEQTKPSLDSLSKSSSCVASPRGGSTPQKPPPSSLVSLSPSHEILDGMGRPRRKLPTPPVARQPSPIGGVSPAASPSKSSKARVAASKNPAFRNCSFESHESGGDSDFDTSSSYPFQDDDRLLASSLRSKLRLTGLESPSQIHKKLPSPVPPSMQSPRRAELLTKENGLLSDRVYDTYQNRRGDVEQSDTSSDASEPYIKEPQTKVNDNNPPLKFNRAFSLRRARLGCDDLQPSSPHPSDKKKPARPSSAGTSSTIRRSTPLGATKSYSSMDGPSVSSSYVNSSRRSMKTPLSKGVTREASPLDSFDRTDGGRFSLRLSRSASSAAVVKSSSKPLTRSSSKKSAPRSNSTLSAKEVDFQNWKRRKNYDPMKAAAEGRKKQVERKVSKTSSNNVTVNENGSSPSPMGSLLRSASFHGTAGPGVRWTKKNDGQHHHHYASEDDGPFSMEDEQQEVTTSPLRKSPTSPHQLCNSPARRDPASSSFTGRRTSLRQSDEGEVQHPHRSPSRKVSLEESGSEGKRSPLSVSAVQSTNSRSSGRPKPKMEALDNLVISTIHSLSIKVRTTSESLLQKLKSQYNEEGDRAALLDEVLSHLSESDQSLTSGQTKSTSRELAGTLRNLKKIEHALEVIDRVIIVGDDDYLDDEQLDDVPNEWIESDY